MNKNGINIFLYSIYMGGTRKKKKTKKKKKSVHKGGMDPGVFGNIYSGIPQQPNSMNDSKPSDFGAPPSKKPKIQSRKISAPASLQFNSGVFANPFSGVPQNPNSMNDSIPGDFGAPPSKKSKIQSRKISAQTSPAQTVPAPPPPVPASATALLNREQSGQVSIAPPGSTIYKLIKVNAVNQLFESTSHKTHEYDKMGLKQIYEDFMDDKDFITIFNVTVTQTFDDNTTDDHFWILEDVLYTGIVDSSLYKDSWFFETDKKIIDYFFTSEYLLENIKKVILPKDNNKIKIEWNKDIIFFEQGGKFLNFENDYECILTSDYYKKNIQPYLRECNTDSDLCNKIRKIAHKFEEPEKGIPLDTLVKKIDEKSWQTTNPNDVEYYHKLEYALLQSYSDIRGALSPNARDECNKCFKYLNDVNKVNIDRNICYGLNIELNNGDVMDITHKDGMSRYQCEHVANFVQMIKYIGVSSTFWKSYYNKIFECYFKSFKKDDEYNTIKNIMCQCYAASSAIFNQVKANINILDFELIYEDDNTINIIVKENTINIDKIFNFLLKNTNGINGTEKVWSHQGDIFMDTLLKNYKKLKNKIKQNKLIEDFKLYIKTLATNLTTMLNNITIFGKRGYKGLYLLFGYILTLSMIDQNPPTDGSSNIRGAVFDYKNSVIAPEFIKKFGVSFVTEFKNYFDLSEQCAGTHNKNIKGGGKIDIIKLDTESYDFLKKYEVVLEYIYNIKYSEQKTFDSINLLNNKMKEYANIDSDPITTKSTPPPTSNELEDIPYSELETTEVAETTLEKENDHLVTQNTSKYTSRSPLTPSKSQKITNQFRTPKKTTTHRYTPYGGGKKLKKKTKKKPKKKYNGRGKFTKKKKRGKKSR